MMRRKVMAMAIATVLAGSMVAAPVSAAVTTSGHTDFTMYVPNDPVYTVTVPETVEVSATEHTFVPITASDVKYIPEGKKISVTYQRGNGTMGRFYLEGVKEETGKTYLMTMMVKGTNGEFKSGALEKQLKGLELAAFTEDGTAQYEIYPRAFDYPQYEGKDSNLAIQKGVNYSAYIDYGIGLADVQ